MGRCLHFFGGATRQQGIDLPTDHGDHYVLDLGETSAPDDDAIIWTTAADLPNPRNHLGAAALGGLAYAIGGQHEERENSDNQVDVYAYDPNADAWSAVEDLPKPLGHVSAATFIWNHRIVTAGGVTHEGDAKIMLADVFAYDPAENAWSSHPCLPARRQSPVAAVIKDQIIVTGGSSVGLGATTTWIGTLPFSGLLADFTADNVVDRKDLITLALLWLQSQTAIDIAPLPNGDGSVNLSEFAALADQWSLECDIVYYLMATANPNRADTGPLEGQTLSQNIYVYIAPETDVEQVKFFLDDPNQTEGPLRTENLAPFDLQGGSIGQANPFDTTVLSDGPHTLTVAITLAGGDTLISTAAFTVNNDLYRIA